MGHSAEKSPVPVDRDKLRHPSTAKTKSKYGRVTITIYHLSMA